MSIKTYTPAEAIQDATARGCVEISEGVYLRNKDIILSDTDHYCELTGAYGTHLYDSKNEFVDFTQAPFWITTNFHQRHISQVHAVYCEDDVDYVLKLLAYYA